jgi:hypothetical protein
MSEHEREHDPWKVLSPFRLEEVRPCDLVVCRECKAVRYVGDLDLTKRSPGMFEDEIEGVFCPGCGQLIFDRKGWIAHKVEQGLWDERQGEGKRGGEPSRSGPLVVAAAVDEG